MCAGCYLFCFPIGSLLKTASAMHSYPPVSRLTPYLTRTYSKCCNIYSIMPELEINYLLFTVYRSSKSFSETNAAIHNKYQDTSRQISGLQYEHDQVSLLRISVTRKLRGSVIICTDKNKQTSYFEFYSVLNVDGLMHHSVCPLVGIGSPHTLSRKRVCPSPRNR